MDYVKLGNSGLTISRFGLGMMAFGDSKWRPWVLDEDQARPVVRRAVEDGINYFDTADMYSAGKSEEITGKLVKEFCRREEAVIATKAFFPVDLAFKGGAAGGPRPANRPNGSGLSRKRLFHAVDASLKRLGTDYVDLFQVHRFDPETPLEETMEALDDIVKSGKARYIGASSMAAWQFAKAQQVARENGWTRFSSMQNHYNLIYREEEREMIPLCHDQGVAVIPWSPLARGLLSRPRSCSHPGSAPSVRSQADDIIAKYYSHESDARVRDALNRVAERKNASHAGIALAWLLMQGVAAPIVGITRERDLDALQAALAIGLDATDMKDLSEFYEPHPVAGFG